MLMAACNLNCSVKYGQPGRLTLTTLTSCFHGSMGAVIPPQACTAKPSALQDIKLKANLIDLCLVFASVTKRLLLNLKVILPLIIHRKYARSIDNCLCMSIFVYIIGN